MIHKKSRMELALALRQYASGLKTNYELDCVQVDWRDRGALAVKQESWFLYDDMYRHRAVGRHRISKKDKREIAKMILFLHSDNEYLWPDYHRIPILDMVVGIITFGFWQRKVQHKYEQFLKAGEFRAWPFISRNEFQIALLNPKYCSTG